MEVGKAHQKSDILIICLFIRSDKVELSTEAERCLSRKHALVNRLIDGSDRTESHCMEAQMIRSLVIS